MNEVQEQFSDLFDAQCLVALSSSGSGPAIGHEHVAAGVRDRRSGPAR
ncbi:hypothetical protein AB0O34_26735 [Sphaerisporangium sp. NPDC088356]